MNKDDKEFSDLLRKAREGDSGAFDPACLWNGARRKSTSETGGFDPSMLWKDSARQEKNSKTLTGMVLERLQELQQKDSSTQRSDPANILTPEEIQTLRTLLRKLVEAGLTLGLVNK